MSEQEILLGVEKFRFDAILRTNIPGWNPESSPEINVAMTGAGAAEPQCES